MQFAVYGAVLAIALGSVLLGLDWVSAPMSPMVDTKAGLSAALPPAPPKPSTTTVTAPAVPITPTTPVAPAPPSTEYFCAGEPAGAVGSPSANIGAPIIAPGLNPSRIGLVRHSGAGRDGSAGCGAGAAGELQCKRLHRGLSLVSRSRLHLSAKRRAAQALLEVASRHAA